MASGGKSTVTSQRVSNVTKKNDTANSKKNGSAAIRPERLLDAYRTMFAARKSDDKMLNLLKQGKIFFHIGGSGHEAVQVGTAFAMKPGYDWAYPYYRDMAFSFGFGYAIEDVFLDVLHRAKGPDSAGFAMPFHWTSPKWHILSQ